MQTIKIEDFFAIRHAEILVTKATIFIGEQASGKSTVAKLIHFFKTFRQDLLLMMYESINEEIDIQLIVRYFLGRIKRKFYDYFGSTKHLQKFEITFNFSEQKDVKLTLGDDGTLVIRFNNNFFSEMHAQLTVPLKRLRLFSAKQNVTAELEFTSSLTQLNTVINKLFEDFSEPIFIPAGRNIAVNYPEQFQVEFYGNLRGELAQLERGPGGIQSADLFLMRRFLEHVQQVKERFRGNDFAGLIDQEQEVGRKVDIGLLKLINDKVVIILKGRYKSDQFGEKILYDDQSDKNYVYLNNASTGQQEVIRILQDIFLVCLEQKNAFRVIEEPEAHLWPMAQKHIIELLALMLNGTESQVVITTHSPYFLSVFNNLLYAMRVANLNGHEQEISEVINQRYWLDPHAFNIYFFANGLCQSIMDKRLGLIDQNLLDGVSEVIGDEFDILYTMQAQAH